MVVVDDASIRRGKMFNFAHEATGIHRSSALRHTDRRRINQGI
jgi:hypothetical protein